MTDELAMQVRGATVRGVVGSVDDSGDVQTATVTTADGVTRSQVEVHQPYGLASVPPDAQPLTVVMSIGADQGHQVAMQLWSAYRWGNLLPGEVALWHWGGSGVHLKAGGNIDLLAAALLQIAAQGITITAAGGITITGPVEFKSAVTFDQAVTFHSDVSIGGNLVVSGTVTGKDAAGKAL